MHQQKYITDAYLNNHLESTSNIGIAANNNHNVHIANSHVKERAISNLPNWTSTKFFSLHNMHSECIHHIATEQTTEAEMLCQT